MYGLLYLTGAFLIVCRLQQANAIKCYECNSHNDTRCELEVVPDDLHIECPEKHGKPYILCRKIKQVIDFEVNGLPPDSRVIRSCGWDDSSYKNKCYQRSGFGGRQEVCACDTDLCNASGIVVSTMSLLVGLLLLKIAIN